MAIEQGMITFSLRQFAVPRASTTDIYDFDVFIVANHPCPEKIIARVVFLTDKLSVRERIFFQPPYAFRDTSKRRPCPIKASIYLRDNVAPKCVVISHNLFLPKADGPIRTMTKREVFVKVFPVPKKRNIYPEQRFPQCSSTSLQYSPILPLIPTPLRARLVLNPENLINIKTRKRSNSRPQPADGVSLNLSSSSKKIRIEANNSTQVTNKNIINEECKNLKNIHILQQKTTAPNELPNSSKANSTKSVVKSEDILIINKIEAEVLNHSDSDDDVIEITPPATHLHFNNQTESKGRFLHNWNPEVSPQLPDVNKKITFTGNEIINSTEKHEMTGAHSKASVSSVLNDILGKEPLEAQKKTSDWVATQCVSQDNAFLETNTNNLLSPATTTAFPFRPTIVKKEELPDFWRDEEVLEVGLVWNSVDTLKIENVRSVSTPAPSSIISDVEQRSLCKDYSIGGETTNLPIEKQESSDECRGSLSVTRKLMAPGELLNTMRNCILCGAQFSVAKEWLDHYRRKYNLKRCPKCFECIPSAGNIYKTHLTTHFYDTNRFVEHIQCAYCEEVYQHEDLWDHVINDHLQYVHTTAENGKYNRKEIQIQGHVEEFQSPSSSSSIFPSYQKPTSTPPFLLKPPFEKANVIYSCSTTEPTSPPTPYDSNCFRTLVDELTQNANITGDKHKRVPFNTDQLKNLEEAFIGDPNPPWDERAERLSWMCNVTKIMTWFRNTRNNFLRNKFPVWAKNTNGHPRYSCHTTSNGKLQIFAVPSHPSTISVPTPGKGRTKHDEHPKLTGSKRSGDDCNSEKYITSTSDESSNDSD